MDTVAVTRPVGRGEDTIKLVKEMGWNPLIVHTVELRPRKESELFTDLSRVLAGGPVDWLVLMSPNGAHLLFNILKSHLARSSTADNSLARALVKNGALVETVNLYDSVIPLDARSFKRFIDEIRSGNIRAILFTSSLSASNLFSMSKNYTGPDELVSLLRRIRIGAIGPVTARKLSEIGIPPNMMPETFIIDDALKELLS